MDIINESAVHIQHLSNDWFAPYVQAVDVLRLDLIHPVISGNKWYKLKYNLANAKAHGSKSVLTFGGAYSNHLIATAAAAQAAGIRSIGVVRGIDPGKNLSKTLTDCITWGMDLHFVSREDYDRKEDDTWLKSLSARFGDPYIIPEGGANEQGRRGAEDIAALIPSTYTNICVSIGTGTTFAGIRNATPASVQVSGFVPMKNGIYLQPHIIDLLEPMKNSNWRLFDDWHFGGFGKSDDTLISFMNDFYIQQHIPLDIVYTGKMMYGMTELLKSGYFPHDARVLCVHTGGLQGNSSVSAKLKYTASNF